jgi:23S rRNA pseudouridine1911/1915/1917 synthase
VADAPAPPRAERVVVERVGAEVAGARLDRFVAELPAVATRSQAKRLIDAGRVRVDGVVRKSSFPLRAGTEVAVELFETPKTTITPEPLPLVVLYEDSDLLAVDKPPGLVVHPAPGWRSGTLVNALAHRLGTLADVGAPERPGIVHRLDRDTSGVILVAKTAAAHRHLARQFRDRHVDKRYLAVVRGVVSAASGVVDRPIGRHPHERKRMSVHSRRGRPAVTRWTVLERFHGATLLRVHPETGRTHQIRVHLAAIGHPVVGDPVYGVRRRGGAAAGPLATFPRQALHAEEIRFRLPTGGTPIAIKSPLPPDLDQLVAALRQLPATTGKSPSQT